MPWRRSSRRPDNGWGKRQVQELIARAAFDFDAVYA